MHTLSPEYLGMAVLQYIILLFSVSVHESAHGAAADRCGDPTAKLMGRVSLNPIVHIDPIGTLVLPFLMMFLSPGFLFGWAKPVPVNPRNFRNYHRDDIIVSLAGIAGNLLLVLVGALLLRLFVTFLPGTVPDVALIFVAKFVTLNAVLAMFNLIPIPPLDGSHILLQMLPPNAVPFFAKLESVSFILIIFIAMPMMRVVMVPVLRLIGLLAGVHFV